MEDKILVKFDRLYTSFVTDKGIVRAVNGVSFDIPKGRTLAVVGESGSGKSVTALSLMGLITEPQGRIDKGAILFEGRDVTKFSKEEKRLLRGRDISMIFQEPMTSLNPSLRVGFQIREVYEKIMGLSRAEAEKKAVEILDLVEIKDPEERIKSFPHELSGGQRQRVMIAIALASSPKLLIADEPTTALDVTIQAEVLDLMARLQEEIGMSILLITHDLGVVAEMADQVVVMYGGRVMEKTDVYSIFDRPRHPYTRGLLKARPRLDDIRGQLYNIPGSVPNPIGDQVGCPFANRCDHTMDICKRENPQPINIEKGHEVACFLYKKGR